MEKGSDYLSMTNSLVQEIYSHVNMLANSKYKEPLKYLKTKHKCYDSEDFVQDSVRNILHDFKNKKFESLKKFKAFMNMSVEFTYLKEKRKYFFTKLRGGEPEVSLDDNYFENKTYADVISGDNDVEIDKFIYNNLATKHLYVFFDWKVCKVGLFDDLKKLKNGYLLSVTKFLNKQRDCGKKETIAWYKQHKFYMTQVTFDLISQSILNYMNSNNLIELEKEREKYVYNRCSVDKQIEERQKVANKCTCGHIKEDYNYSELTWQCPKCGKIHFRDDLIKHNLNEFSSYKPQETISISKKVLINSLERQFVTSAF